MTDLDAELAQAQQEHSEASRRWNCGECESIAVVMALAKVERLKAEKIRTETGRLQKQILSEMEQLEGRGE